MVQSKDLNPNKIPKHIAIIMDGNGRWAKSQGAKRIFGHRHAIKAVRDTTENCAELGVKFLTLYAFSTENWARPEEEVQALMQLLVSTIEEETPSLKKNGIRLLAIGDLDRLPLRCQKQLAGAMAATASNTKMDLILALNYSGRWDIANAAKKVAEDAATGKINVGDISEEVFARYLTTAGVPDPELLIRTSGEMRISNFLLWQMAYTEIYITDVLWPDFRTPHLLEAIQWYQQRERRFGKTSEQILAGA